MEDGKTDFLESKVDEETGSNKRIILFAVSVVILIWIGNWLFLWFFSDRSDVRGDFGDMFGAANALFSGLAFAFLIYTILLQREELKLQREELKLQRNALERQADELGKTTVLQQQAVSLQKAQLDLTRKQIDDHKKKQTTPFFVQSGDVTVSYSSGLSIGFKFKNIGASASGVRITSNLPFLNDPNIGDLPSGEVCSVGWQVQPPIPPDRLSLDLQFLDVEGHKQTQKIIILKNDHYQNVTDMYSVENL